MSVIASFVLIFLYFPLFVVVLYSFNKNKVNSFPIQGFSFKWYQTMIQDQTLMQALGHSILIAVISTMIAVILSLLASLVLSKYNFPGKKLFTRGILLPLMLPGILTGVALLSFFQEIGIQQSMLAVILGHTTFLIAIILPQLLARLTTMNQSIKEASSDLGASGLQTFLYIILPSIKTALIGSAMLSFTLSFDEIPVTFFLNGIFSTLPLQIWGMTRNGITPEINAISTVIFIVSLFLIVFSTKLTQDEKNNGE